MRHLWTWSAIAALVVGAITWGAMFWAVIFHRKRKGDSDERRPAADAVQPAASRSSSRSIPTDHRRGAVRVHRAGAELRREATSPTRT